MSEKLTSQKAGVDLHSLSGILFVESGNKWYGALILEIIVGFLSVVILAFAFGERVTWVFAVLSLGFYIIAYCVRLNAEMKRLLAETMRRQSVFAEALGWKINPIQLVEWREKAGLRSTTKIKDSVRDPDYYASKSMEAVERLSHMTTESAFYTRMQYRKLGILLTWIAIVAASVTMVSLAMAFWFGDRSIEFSSIVLSLIPVVISSDIIGWAFRLHKMSNDIFAVEKEFEQLGPNGSRNFPSVMMLVGEYNCIVVGGIPLHQRWFNRLHDEIDAEWQAYITGSGGLPG